MSVAGEIQADAPAPSRLTQFLLSPVACDTAEDLAAHWQDTTITLRLVGAGRFDRKIGAHLRRSFLGALGPSASAEAQAGGACPWDPPCALDLFCREQMRGPRGDGLPKPYVLSATRRGLDLEVSLRLFGIACEWALIASEALIAGLRGILPWHKLGAEACPAIKDRGIEAFGVAPTPAPRALRIHHITPMDISGRDPAQEPWTILSRMIRRVDGVARWCGAGLAPDTSRAMSLHCRDLAFGLDGLQRGVHHSPNRAQQKRDDPVITGALDVAGDLVALWPVLLMAERCHVGRHAVEGLGQIRLDR